MSSTKDAEGEDAAHSVRGVYLVRDEQLTLFIV